MTPNSTIDGIIISGGKMDIKEIEKIFQDSFTEGLFLLKNPDMGGKNYGLGVIKLENAYRKLPTLLSHIRELEAEVERLKKLFAISCNEMRAEGGYEGLGLCPQIEELENKLSKIKVDHSIGKLTIDEWPETPNY